MMMDDTVLKAPFPYFGGKSKAASVIWEALGDVDHYVEPFAGSLAVLLGRPHMCNRPYHSETVNDADGLLVNAWRSIQRHPNETAEFASSPSFEADIHAQHLALLKWRSENQLEHLMGDPLWCNPMMAGWWLMGVSRWIGSGYCSGNGSWVSDPISNRMVKRVKGSEKGLGVARHRQGVITNGCGVDQMTLRQTGVFQADGDPHSITMPGLLQWFKVLSARLRHVRILNGDWKRATTTGVIKTLPVRQSGIAGVFLDPPYSGAVRTKGLYAVDSETIAQEVTSWCAENSTDPSYRIVLAGFEGEHNVLEDIGWRKVNWYVVHSGMASGGTEGSKQHEERLWLSPNCLRTVETARTVDFDS